MKKLIIVTLLFISPIIFAEDQKPAENQQVKQIVEQVTQQVFAKQQTPQISQSYKDAFLRFVLEKAQKYSEKGEQAIGKAVDLATEEAPLLAKEYLHWKFWENLLYFLVPAFLFVVIGSLDIYFIRKGFKLGWGDSYEPSRWWVAVVFCSIGSGISLLITFINLDCLFTSIQISIAPRVFIIEQLMQLIK